MTKEQVQEVFAYLDSLDIVVPKEDGTTEVVKTPIHLFCNTNVSQIIDWRDGSVIWDDDKELVKYFSYNSNEMMNLTPAISPGERPVAPLYFGTLEYVSIISMRAVLIKETFDKLCDKLNISDQQYNQLYHKFFIETDQRYIINRKKQISYSTQHSKEYDKDKHYDDAAAYIKTVHPVALY